MYGARHDQLARPRHMPKMAECWVERQKLHVAHDRIAYAQLFSAPSTTLAQVA